MRKGSISQMNPPFGKRKWIKLWTTEWLDGTTRYQMTGAQRAFWVDLIAIAGASPLSGRDLRWEGRRRLRGVSPEPITGAHSRANRRHRDTRTIRADRKNPD